MKSATKPKICALVLCAGAGSRTGLKYNKLLHPVGGKTVLEMTLDALHSAGVGSVTAVVSEHDYDAVRGLVEKRGNVSLVIGGSTRTESARNGLAALNDCDIVLIHDGARPFVSKEIITASIDSAVKYGSGIAAIPMTDTVKQVDGNGRVVTLNRDELLSVQTPQSFDYAEIKTAYDSFEGVATDDSCVYESAGFTPRFVAGSPSNKKITTAEDLLYLGSADLRIGTGFDVHELRPNRKLILGGIDIPFDKGLLGHSDADVLVHAVMDALLSAAGLPDIGVLFPDTDPAYEGADSIKLLSEVGRRLRGCGFETVNISAVVMAQAPKLAVHIPLMRRNIADALGIKDGQINVSATTTEHLGVIGEGKGMASSAVCLLKQTATKASEA